MKSYVKLLLSGFGFFIFTMNVNADPCSEKTAKGEQLMNQNKNDEAETILKEAQKACGQAKVKSYRLNMALGTLYFQSHRCEDAIPLFEEGIKMDSKFPLGYMNLSACYTEDRKWDLSADTAIKGTKITKDPDTLFKLYYNAGFAMMKKGMDGTNEYSAAIKYFNESIKFNSKYADTYYQLGMIYKYMNNLKSAKDYFKKGAEKGHEESKSELVDISK